MTADAQGRQFAENALLQNMIPLEMTGEIEHWNFSGDAVSVVLRTARRCRCREMHYWFVNRDGATRCVGCDEAYLKSKAAAEGRGAAAPGPVIPAEEAAATA